MLADPASLPFADGVFDVAFCDDLLRFLDVRGAQAALREAARVLRPGALLLAWDLAPPAGRFRWWQRFWLRAYGGRIASETSLMSLAERSGFDYTRTAALRPFFWPPVPRASFIASVLPPGLAAGGRQHLPAGVGRRGNKDFADFTDGGRVHRKGAKARGEERGDDRAETTDFTDYTDGGQLTTRGAKVLWVRVHRKGA